MKMNIKGIVMDWAGTSVDYGSIAPTQAFIDVFAEFNIDISAEIVRKYMGIHKKDHLRKILSEENVTRLWFENYGEEPNEDNVDEIFDRLGPAMNKSVSEFSDPIPGVLEFIEHYRNKGVKFGSCTGYVTDMMKILLPEAEAKGLKFDSVVSPDEVGAGRPYPFMIYKNAINMQTFPLWQMVKIGDTIADIEEGLNAGMWVIGITKTGNEMGLSQDEVENTGNDVILERITQIEKKFREAGANYVAVSVDDCYDIIDEIDFRISKGEKPL
jgi:phosphonoacetaldehyde hydrolase